MKSLAMTSCQEPPGEIRHSDRRILVSALMLSAMLLSPATGKEEPKGALARLSGIPASKFSKVISLSTSPDKRFAAAVGSVDGSAPDWEELPSDETYFLESDSIGNYLVDLKKDRVTGILDGDHMGTRPTYNHESVSYSWSPDAHWLVEVQSWKWESSVCTIHRVSDQGSLTGRLDFKIIADQIVKQRLGEMGVQVLGEENGGYESTVHHIRIDNDGSLTAEITADIPKNIQSESVRVLAAATISVAADGTLSAKVGKVTPLE